MRVLLDLTYAQRAPLSGTGVYQRALLGALSERPDVTPLAVADTRRGRPAGGGLGSARNLLRDAWFSGAVLPGRAARTGAEVIHHAMPATAPLAPCPQVVTVLDLAFARLPEHFDPAWRRYAQVVHRAAALRAAVVICISETTAADVRELWGVAAERIVVAPLGPGQALPPPAPAAGPPRHFLYVGDAEPRKNLGLLLEAYATYRTATERPLELVLAGRLGPIGAAGVRVLDAPDPDELAHLYASAAALVHPSLYEGFGMTPLEAMGLGTPVIAARSPGVAEICGEAALLVGARDAGPLAAALQEVAGDAGLRGELARRGRERAAQFSWARCAERHAAAYSLALRR